KLTSHIGAKQLAEALSIPDRTYSKTLRLKGTQRAFLLLSTIRRFCQSSDETITAEHFPKYGRLWGEKEEIVDKVRSEVLRNAPTIWRRMTDVSDSLPLGHDGYLKVWALTLPRLPFDFILLDEAQDTNAVVLGVLGHQDAQLVYVGDRHQQI